MEDVTDIKDIDPKVVAKKVQAKARKYRKELTLFGTGVFVGYFVSRRKFGKKELELIRFVNDRLESDFAKHNGNFQIEGGGYIVPIIHKK